MSSNNDPVIIHMTQRNSDVLPGTTSSDLKGPVLSFHNLCYEEKEKKFAQKIIKRKKLSNINGIMKPGLNAVMGPSGGGETLLLEILAARKVPSGLSGDVWIHGIPEDASFPHSSGYMVHDDVVLDTLTVRENLQFSAALRLPPTMTKEEKNKRIDEVIEELGLVQVADSKVRPTGLRKKTSIGMELILHPSILFLDEPTNGLDWRTANDVIRLLKRISEQGRTIIFSIHQPRYSIFQQFDSLTILASGELMYHGPAQKALEYFKSAGFPCEFYNNPAELFLDFFHGVIKRESEDHEGNQTEMPSETDESEIRELANNFAKSTFYNDTKTELEECSRDENKRCLERKETPCASSFSHQFISVTRRSFQNFVRNTQDWITKIITTLVAGLLLGAMFLWLKNDCYEINKRVLMLFLLMSYQCRSSITAGDLFMSQKKQFLHESISGYYGVSSYFFGNLLPDLLLNRLLPSFIFIFAVYFIAGLKLVVENFFIMIFTLMMVAFSSISMTLAVAAGHSDTYFQRCVMTVYFAFTMIFLGLSFIETMTPEFQWLQYFSIPYYGFTALQHNEFLGRNFCPSLNTTNGNICPGDVICSGEAFLITKNIDLSPWGFWQNHVALIILMIIFLIIAYLKMYFLKSQYSI